MCKRVPSVLAAILPTSLPSGLLPQNSKAVTYTSTSTTTNATATAASITATFDVNTTAYTITTTIFSIASTTATANPRAFSVFLPVEKNDDF